LFSLKIRLDQIQATLRDVVVPALKGWSRFDITSVVKGAQRDGGADVAGWAEIATKDFSVKTQLRSVDLVALRLTSSSLRRRGFRRVP